MSTEKPQVVFACRKNGGRSVISRLLTEHYAGDAVTALSAGTEPAGCGARPGSHWRQQS